MAIKLEEVAEALKQSGIADSDAKVVLQNLKTIEEENKALAEENKEPKPEKQLIFLNTQTSGDVGYGVIIEIPSADSISDAPEHLYKAVREQNTTTRKGRKYPIRTVGEAVEGLKRKFQKEYNIKIKTKVITPMLIIDNDIPNPTTSNKDVD